MGKQVLRFHVCDFCGADGEIITNKVMLNGHRWEIDLCPQHTSDLDDDLFTWTSCGRKVGEPSIFDSPRRAVRLVMDSGPKFGPTPAITTPEDQHRVEEMPATAERWRLTDHALQRMEERGFDIRDVLWTAERPEDVVQDKKDPNLNIYRRGGCKVVANPHTLDVVTVTYSEKHPMSDNYKKVSS